jgi:hypothetical protein
MSSLLCAYYKLLSTVTLLHHRVLEGFLVSRMIRTEYLWCRGLFCWLVCIYNVVCWWLLHVFQRTWTWRTSEKAPLRRSGVAVALHETFWSLTNGMQLLGCRQPKWDKREIFQTSAFTTKVPAEDKAIARTALSKSRLQRKNYFRPLNPLMKRHRLQTSFPNGSRTVGAKF